MNSNVEQCFSIIQDHLEDVQIQMYLFIPSVSKRQ